MTHDPYPRTPPDPPLPHAELLAAVRNANPDRMADGLRQAQFDEILAAHPDVRGIEQKAREEW